MPSSSRLAKDSTSIVAGIAVAEVDPLADFGRDLRGQRDLHAGLFDAVLERALPANVRGMGQDAPGVMLKLVPLFHEIIADVIADFFDQLAVGEWRYR